MADETPEPDAPLTATTQIKLSPPQMKLLLHLQMLQRQTGDATTQVTLLVTRGRIELLHQAQIQRIVFS